MMHIRSLCFSLILGYLAEFIPNKLYKSIILTFLAKKCFWSL